MPALRQPPPIQEQGLRDGHISTPSSRPYRRIRTHEQLLLALRHGNEDRRSAGIIYAAHPKRGLPPSQRQDTHPSNPHHPDRGRGSGDGGVRLDCLGGTGKCFASCLEGLQVQISVLVTLDGEVMLDGLV